MNRFSLIWRGLAATLAVQAAISTSAAEGEADSPPETTASTARAWAHPDLASMDAAVPPQPAQRPVPPVLISLEALGKNAPQKTPTNLPPLHRMATLQPEELPDTTNVLQKIEQADVAQVLRRAEELMRAGEREATLGLITGAIARVKMDASLFVLHHRLGTYAFRLRDYERATRHMQQALDLRPGNAALACNLAAALMTRGDVDRALEVLSGIQLHLLQSPDLLFSTHFNLACAHSLKGAAEPAVSNLLRAAHFDARAVLASIGDTQLDPIRGDARVRELIPKIEEQIRGQDAHGTPPDPTTEDGT